MLELEEIKRSIFIFAQVVLRHLFYSSGFNLGVVFSFCLGSQKCLFLDDILDFGFIKYCENRKHVFFFNPSAHSWTFVNH